MKLIVSKSKTIKDGEGYKKTIYSVEAETEDLEKTKQELEIKINEWLDGKASREIPQTNRGKCADCGKEIDPKYRFCYKCNLKRRA